MTIEEWAKDFKSYVNTLDMQRDDYNGIMEYIDDALSLLKEQEPRVMTLSEIEQSDECIVWFEDDQFNNYALVDGIDQRNGWVWLSHMGLQQRRDYEDYGKRWRCWTKRPAEDQRKAVKLENADGNH